MNDADDIRPLLGKAGGFGEFQKSGRHLRPAMKACLQAGGGMAALALVLFAGRNAAFLAGEAGPVGEQGGGTDAKASRVRGESSGANGGAVSAREVWNQAAVMNACETQELGAGWGTAKLAGSGAKSAKDLRAGKHGEE